MENFQLQEECEFVPDYEEDVVPVLPESIHSTVPGFAQVLPESPHSTLSEFVSVPVEEPDFPEPACVSDEQPKRSKSRKRVCPVCNATPTTVKFHVLKYHLPWYINPRLGCSICQTTEKSFCYFRERHILVHPNFSALDGITWCYLMCGFLTCLSWKLGLPDMFALVGLVASENLVPEFQADHEYFSSDARFLLKMFADQFHINFSLVLHPVTSVVACIHWKVITSLILKLSSKDRQKLCSSYLLLTPSGIPIAMDQLAFPTLRVIDSHFHLDSMFTRTKCNFFHQLHNLFSGDVELLAGIANFAYPKSWGVIQNLLHENDSRLFFTIGVHPHRLVNSVFQKSDSLISEILQTLSSNLRCVGVGEIGLDFTSCCKCQKHFTKFQRTACTTSTLNNQYKFLDNLFSKLSNLQGVLVLHCRGEGAGAELRRLLLKHGLKLKKIHCHCFTGNLIDLQEWLRDFPNIVFGVTAKSVDDLLTREALVYLPRDKYIIESDAPHLPPPKLKSTINHPWALSHVIYHLSNLLNLDISVIAEETARNATNLYELK